MIGSILFVATGSSVALDNKFKDWLKLVRSDALLSGVSESTLDQAFSDVKLVPRIIELDQNQPEGRQTFTEYLRRVVPETRIEAAQKFKIKSTPTLVINDEPFKGTLEYKSIKKMLEKLI